MMTRLKTQLPSSAPTAMSAASTRTTALTPVMSSGSEVTEAIRISPIQVPPRPVPVAMMSPYRASWVPATAIRRSANPNSSQTRAASIRSRSPALALGELATSRKAARASYDPRDRIIHARH
jgi:hypothetical protein